MSGPPTAIDEPSCDESEARHGCAGARPSDGGCGGPCRGPPRRSMSRPVTSPRRATAAPGRVRALGGVGGHIGAPPRRTMSPTRRALLAVLAVALVPGRAAAQLDELLKQLPQLPGGTRLPI